MEAGGKEKELLGSRIKSLREYRKMTQEQLAERAGMNPVYLSNIERGKENPTLNVIIRISIALKIEMWELFDFKHETSSKALRDMLRKFANEIDDEEKLKTAVKIVRAVMR